MFLFLFDFSLDSHGNKRFLDNSRGFFIAFSLQSKFDDQLCGNLLKQSKWLGSEVPVGEIGANQQFLHKPEYDVKHEEFRGSIVLVNDCICLTKSCDSCHCVYSYK